jgi:hypothetical protein
MNNLYLKRKNENGESQIIEIDNSTSYKDLIIKNFSGEKLVIQVMLIEKTISINDTLLTNIEAEILKTFLNQLK